MEQKNGLSLVGLIVTLLCFICMTTIKISLERKNNLNRNGAK
jgi:hypothetical protein